jgi:coenzyme F420 hydrogenase subunit beta
LSVDFTELSLNVFGKMSRDDLIGNYRSIHGGHATDYSLRYGSASGGIVTALLIFALEKGIIDGVIVTGMQTSNPLEPKVFVARSKEEVISASQSKYCPVPLNVALREILNEESKEKKFAVVGLPCHLHGIRKAEMLNRELARRVVLHIGLFCSFIHDFQGTEYLLWKMSLKKNEIQKLSYRGKGWLGGMTITLRDGRTKFCPYTVYNSMWRSFFVPLRCTLCVDHCSELADISCGDLWLPQFMNDRVGTSVVICRTREGNEILSEAVYHGMIEMETVSRDGLVESQRSSLLMKKSYVGTRFSLFRMLRKTIPFYNQELPEMKIDGLLHSLALYLQIGLSSKRHLWRLLTPVASMLERIEVIYSSEAVPSGGDA